MWSRCSSTTHRSCCVLRGNGRCFPRTGRTTSLWSTSHYLGPSDLFKYWSFLWMLFYWHKTVLQGKLSQWTLGHAKDGDDNDKCRRGGGLLMELRTNGGSKFVAWSFLLHGAAVVPTSSLRTSNCVVASSNASVFVLQPSTTSKYVTAVHDDDLISTNWRDGATGTRNSSRIVAAAAAAAADEIAVASYWLRSLQCSDWQQLLVSSANTRVSPCWQQHDSGTLFYCCNGNRSGLVLNSTTRFHVANMLYNTTNGRDANKL